MGDVEKIKYTKKKASRPDPPKLEIFLDFFRKYSCKIAKPKKFFKELTEFLLEICSITQESIIIKILLL